MHPEYYSPSSSGDSPELSLSLFFFSRAHSSHRRRRITGREKGEATVRYIEGVDGRGGE